MGNGEFPPEAVEIVKRVGDWYNRVKESLEDVEPCSSLIANRNVLLTRRANDLYVHLNTDPIGSAVKLAPIAIEPKRATLLNNGQPVECAVELVPSEHVVHKPCLRLRNLPVNEMANTVLIVKLEFEGPIEDNLNAAPTPDMVD